ncbi:2TM domain-containing protein [Flavobacterium muglaense]|uniref:2TM domain-containing protein n=1 Tax=Flavobacterium muglaense TaxID=2764716 RepID=A0A923SIA8_9FLAO|nr:2TM domain-containing protein [Flavobacterium muglaense]MBC5836616.1 2TM domain-containing protein [Flavobacterium muglaense]MBC5843118.1 2TM domain-containing protein [Flavobacterium muglaense]
MEIVMENRYENDDRYYKARKRVDEIKGFYGNLISYVAVNLGLLVLNLVTSPEYLWFFWPLLGWGLGVLIHGMKVFNFMPFLGKDWEQQKIKEFMEKEKENEQKRNWQ